MAAQENTQRPPTPTILKDAYTLSASSDLTISVQGPKDNEGQRPIVRFKVEKSAVTCFSQYFENSLRFNTKFGHEVILKDDDAGAVRVWLIYMHAAATYATKQPQSKMDSVCSNGKPKKIAEVDGQRLFNSPGVADTNITRIWHIINAGDKYLFDVSLLCGFFEKWYAKHVNLARGDADLFRQLAFPCYMFDHAQGFSAVTNWLAYNFDGHITEKRPIGIKFKHMHLAPPDFVGPMNHARGSLKTVLHRGIWDKAGEVLKKGEDKCRCGKWASVCGRYFAELVKIDAYPLEMVFPKNSINTILSRLGRFELGSIGNCSICSPDWDACIERAISSTTNSFDGLCIDCMETSRPKRDGDADYWKKLGSDNGRFDRQCRVRHGQKTWYISWCGRDEHRRKLMDEHFEKRSGFY
ncbi:uncharacterized protein N0V89_007946 [Didymosphaeria variabile]|uniref:BTB domain-containing protein n=1 Tax=Didymosphaeria variabile TaxID=1932322 RepID=A0A9W8XFV0_9PLEO|nr:uncharacterized protein N0V89_007946 [Didymosphaeria variabile]KAJ4349332.1 hypothetical protein N0V89_007946 [Didymosphaeria variabile]